MKYKIEKLGNLVELKQGLAINSQSNYLVSEVETSLSLLRIADMPTKRKVIFMSEKTPSRYIANRDDIIYTRTGQVGLVFTGQEGVVHNNCFRVNSLNEKVLLNKYLYWVLKSKYLYTLANTYAAGAAQPDLPHTSFKKIKIPLPDINLQEKIANILSRYDEAIENNNKRIKLLEQMAQNLYKEWFVRFRFPGYENCEFENGIPVGWNVERIGELYHTTSGGTPSRNHEEYYQEGTYPWIKTGELKDCPIIDTEEYITEDAIKHSSAKVFEKDSLIIAMYGATIGQLGINKMSATCNQACCVLRPKENRAFGIYYLFNFFKENRDFIIGLGNGAAQQNLSQILINKIKILNPPKEVLEPFEKMQSVFFEKIYFLQRANKNLAKQRDLLLPRLMSGKLEV